MKLLTQLSGKQAGGEEEEGGTRVLEAVGESAELCRWYGSTEQPKAGFQAVLGDHVLGGGVQQGQGAEQHMAEVGALRQGHPVPSGHLLPHHLWMSSQTHSFLSPWLCQGKGETSTKTALKPRAHSCAPSSCKLLTGVSPASPGSWLGGSGCSNWPVPE